MSKKLYNKIFLTEEPNSHETMLTDFTDAEPKTIFDGGYSSFALTPYSAGDNGVTFDQQLFSENHDYVKFLTEKKQLLIDDLHDLYEIYKYNKKNLQEILKTVKDKKYYYNNLLKLQEYLDKKMGLKEDLLYWTSEPIDDNKSELGVAEGSITEGVIQEAIADLPRNVSDEIAERATKKMNWERPIILDKGGNGYAYEVGNKILKVTTDESEAVDSRKMIGKTSNYIADVYNVYMVNYDKHVYYIILMEKLKINRDKFLKIYRDLNIIIQKLFSVTYYDIIELHNEDPNNYIKYIKPKLEPELKKYPELNKFWSDLLLIADEVKRMGINSMDYGSITNLGYKPNGTMAFFDLGLSGEKFGNSGQPVELNLESTGDYMTDSGAADVVNHNQSLGLQLERQIYWMPGSQTVEIKKKCRLGGLANGKSAQCGWGDMDSLDLGSPMTKDTEKSDYNISIKGKTDLTDNLPKEANSGKKKKVNEIISEDIDHAGDSSFFYDGTFNQRPGNDAQAPNGDIVSKDLNEIIKKVIEEDIIDYKDFNFNENLTTHGSFENNLNDQGIEENQHSDINGEKKDCLMLYLDIPNWSKITSIIKKEDIYNKPNYGIEKECHITLLYGFDNEISGKQVFDKFKENFNLKPIKVKVTGIGVFESEEFDVVKFNIESEELNNINKIMKNLPNHENFPDYQSHCTIAYCIKGTGKKYIIDFKEPHYFTGNKLVFSSASDKKEEMLLDKTITESPDKIVIDDINLDSEDDNAYPFGMTKNENYLFIGKEGTTHYRMARNEGFSLTELKYLGRIWTDVKIISFWDYPPKNKLDNFIHELEKGFKEQFNLNLNIWNNPDFKIEIYDKNNKTELTPIKNYVKSENPTDAEYQQHIKSPVEKKGVEIPQGIGSKKYGEKLPIDVRQKVSTSEGLEKYIGKIIKENTNFKPLITETLTDVVYHFTSFHKLESILKTNTINLSSGLGSSADAKVMKGMYFLSLSRTKSSQLGYGSNISDGGENSLARIQLNGRLLNNRFKSVPFDYWNIKGDPLKNMQIRGRERFLKDFEYEDRIFSDKGTLPDFNKYVEKIDILFHKENATEESLPKWTAVIKNILELSKNLNINTNVYGNLQDFNKSTNPINNVILTSKPYNDKDSYGGRPDRFDDLFLSKVLALVLFPNNPNEIDKTTDEIKNFCEKNGFKYDDSFIYKTQDRMRYLTFGSAHMVDYLSSIGADIHNITKSGSPEPENRKILQIFIDFLHRNKFANIKDAINYKVFGYNRSTVQKKDYSKLYNFYDNYSQKNIPNNNERTYRVGDLHWNVTDKEFEDMINLKTNGELINYIFNKYNNEKAIKLINIIGGEELKLVKTSVKVLQTSEGLENLIGNIIVETMELKENPNEFRLENGDYVDWDEKNAHPFGIAKADNKLYVGNQHGIHSEMVAKYNSRRDYYDAGRIWLNRKVISFWQYPPKNDIKNFIHDLELAFKYQQGKIVNIWNDPDFKIDIQNPDEKYHNENNLIPLKQYAGSENPESIEHVKSPLQKQKVEVPKGVGSKKYGEELPIDVRQKIQTSESVKLNEDPDTVNVNGHAYKYSSTKSYPFMKLKGSDRVIVGNAMESHKNFMQSNRQYPYNAFEYEGRIWTDLKLISFWNFPPREQIEGFIHGLEQGFKMYQNQDMAIWNDDEYKVDVDYDRNGETIPLKQYQGREDRSAEEKLLHLQTPIEKEKSGKNNVPHGFGSKNYGEKLPLNVRQAVQTSESTELDEVLTLEQQQINYLMQLLTAYNGLSDHKKSTTKGREIMGGITRKASSFGYFLKQNPNRSISLIDKNNKIVRTIADKTDAETINSYKTLADYNDTKFSEFINAIIEKPEIIYINLGMSRTEILQAVKNIRENKRTVASNHFLQLLYQMFKNNRIIVTNGETINNRQTKAITIDEYLKSLENTNNIVSEPQELEPAPF